MRADLEAVYASDEIESSSHFLTTLESCLPFQVKVEWRENEDSLPEGSRWDGFCSFLEKKADVAESLLRDQKPSDLRTSDSGSQTKPGKSSH